MSRLGPALVSLYPRKWRRRYGDELTEMIAAERFSLRMVVDVLAGAIDARLNSPETVLHEKDQKEPMRFAFRCAPLTMSRSEQWRSAAWMIGGSLLLTGVALVLKLTGGSKSIAEALLYGAFPASLMLSNEPMYFRCYSRPARMTLAIGGAVLILLMMWLSVVIAYRI
jgi:hypothetical protein